MLSDIKFKKPIISPPQDIASIIDKTALFVIKNGMFFAQKIRQQEQGNVKFSFLDPSSLYHPYYLAQLTKLAHSDTENKLLSSELNVTDLDKLNDRIKESKSIQKPRILDQTQDTVTNGFLIHIPPGLTMLEMDVMKLTAQFTAKKGKGFLTGLFRREQNSPKFAFIRPNNDLFHFFTVLVDSYHKIDAFLTETLTDMDNAQWYRKVYDQDAVLSRCLKLLNSRKDSKKNNLKSETFSTNKKKDFLSIPWHDFFLVESIEFYNDEEPVLPKPATLKDVITMHGAKKNSNSEIVKDENHTEIKISPTEMVDSISPVMSKNHILSPEPITNGPTVHVVPENFEDIKVVKEQVKKQMPPLLDQHQYVRSPLTLEMVAIAEFAEHMRVKLIDPRWSNQRQLMLNKIQETAKGSNDEIASNILSVAKHRPDLFGLTNEKEIIKKETVENNCHVTSMNGNLGYPFESENDFLSKYPGPRTIQVQFTNIPIGENCSGKIFEIQVHSLKTYVSVIIDWIAEIMQKPTSRLTISAAGVGILDKTKTLASYNIHPHSLLILGSN